MYTYMIADTLYSKVRNRGRWGQIWSRLTRRSRRLFPLEKINTACVVRTRSDAGMRTVPIRQIQGSESRSHEFDRSFNPLRSYNKDRWLNIAMARQGDKVLPPIELIQVGEVYFVRDGHHRISVARALGQQDIEAEVVVWQVNGPLPWEKLETTPDPTGQMVKAGPFYRQAWDNGVRLLEAGLLKLRSFWNVGGTRLKRQVVSPVNREMVCQTTSCFH